MRRFTAVVLIFGLFLSLTGCSLRGVEKDLYRKDTVIYIPADPTTEPREVPEETSEPETESETMETTKKTTSSTSSKKNTSSNKSPTTATTAPATEATTAPTTKPQETEATTEPTTVPTEPPTTSPMETEYLIYDISDYVVGSLERAMMDQVNAYRREAGLSEMAVSERLSAIASVRAYEGCLSWSHTRPDGSDYTTVFQDYGFSAGVAGENLLYTSGGEDGATLVSKWMNAESNRDNLMYEGFTTVGIGIYKANGYVYIACLLAG